jgi:hypothetical protein
MLIKKTNHFPPMGLYNLFKAQCRVAVVFLYAISPISAFAAPSQDVIDKCIKAVDFQGCVQALSGSQTDPGQRSNILNPSTPPTPNTCPPGYGYRGGRHCQEVRCTNAETGSRRDRFDEQLDGKGWTCGKRPFLPFVDYSKPIFVGPLVPASYDLKCPNIEPEFGRENSCLNGQTGK